MAFLNGSTTSTTEHSSDPKVGLVCGTAKTSASAAGSVCGWADSTSFGIVESVTPDLATAARQTDAIRAAVEGE